MNDTLMFIIMFSGVWFLVGIIFFIIGIGMFKNRKRKESNCTLTTYGKVKDIVNHRSYSNNSTTSTWHPVFEYTIGNLTYIKESSFGSSNSKFAIGQDIEIRYNPENYNDFFIPAETGQKTISKIFIIIGIVSISIGIISILLIL